MLLNPYLYFRLNGKVVLYSYARAIYLLCPYVLFQQLKRNNSRAYDDDDTQPPLDQSHGKVVL